VNNLKFKELNILDLENSQDGDKLKVVFEVPGDKFNQSYPKRMTHKFPKKPYYIEKLDNGNRRYEEKLKSIYLEKEEDKKNRKKVDKQLENLKSECKGKKLCNEK